MNFNNHQPNDYTHPGAQDFRYNYNYDAEKSRGQFIPRSEIAYREQGNYLLQFPQIQITNNYYQGRINTSYRQPNHQNLHRHRNHQRGKRAHERTSSNSSHKHLGDSPVSKRQLQKQNSVESQSSTSSPTKGQPKQNKKKSESRLKVLDLKESYWNELFSETLKKVANCEPGEEVNVLLLNLQPSRKTRKETKEQIYNDLLNLIYPLGIEKLSVFGSSLTGLDFVGSDLDFHVELKQPPHEIEGVREVIKRVGKLTRNYQQRNFQVIYNILSARVPIIRLLHQQTKTTCDVNFTSRFGYYNSCFVTSILSFDNRIKGLAAILKLWSKSNKISEKMIMSNYCLLMLMIFYLQNLQEPMLDSIKNNQTSGDPIVLDDKYKWNVYSNDSINLAQNNLSLRQLLVGFFEFYHKLNFTKYIVSIYVGEFVLREEFNRHPDFENYREIVKSGLPPLKFNDPEQFVVQDGFELNLNIGIKCRKNVATFFDLIKASYMKCLQLKDEPFSQLLIKIFTDIEFPTSVPVVRNRKKKFMMTVHSTAGDLKVSD